MAGSIRKLTITCRVAPGARVISGKLTAASAAGTAKPGSVGMTRNTMRVR
jgi:hypothetical protein